MRFNVGPWVYTLSIIENLRDENGDEVLGLCDNAKFEIYLSSDLEPQVRVATLIHELRHAWAGHVPRPRTEEEEADLQSTVTAAFMRDLKAQGGHEALAGMQPEGAPPFIETHIVPCEGVWSVGPVRQRQSVESEARAAGGRAQCGQCCTIMSDGQIVNEPTEFSSGGRTIRRSFYCPHCDHVQSWIEGTDLRGKPNGAVADGPFYDRSGAEKFLKENSLAVGLIVA